MSRIDELRRGRPKNRFVRFSLGGLFVLVLSSWILGSVTGAWSLADFFSERRLANLERFVLEEAIPPLGADADFSDYLGWARDLWNTRGFEASVATLAIAVAAIVMAGLWALVLILPAARNIAHPEPFVHDGTPPQQSRVLLWKGIVAGTRFLLIFLRAIPEYIWAFILITLFGVHAWPAVLALAIHNSGILGKLGAEVVENTATASPRALRALGASRVQVSSFAVFPIVLPRFLLYFFYRWETCVREATVLGMLGFSSLGYWILEARARDRYDEMLFLMLLGALLVIVGDGVSAIARTIVRRAS